MKKFLILLFITCFSEKILLSQTSEVRVNLRDGNVVIGKTSINKLILTTPYGKLDLPFSNVSKIEFGIIKNPSIEGKVKVLLKQLLDEKENVRRTAYEELNKMGVDVLPYINEFISTSEYETKFYENYTLEELLSEIKATYYLSGDIDDNDIVYIDNEYKMFGKSNINDLKLTTPYGTLEIPRSKIIDIEIIYVSGGGENEKIFKLYASKHISSNIDGGWLNTGITLKKGQTFYINSYGEIILASLSNNKYTPDGAVGGGDTYDIFGNYEPSSPTYGNVVFKIGENGDVTKAGSKYKGIASNSGVLYISIYESVYNSSNTGFYTVKVKF